MARRPKRILSALIKLVAVIVAAAAGYGLGTVWAHHEYGVVVTPVASLMAHLAASAL